MCHEFTGLVLTNPCANIKPSLPPLATTPLLGGPQMQFVEGSVRISRLAQGQRLVVPLSVVVSSSKQTDNIEVWLLILRWWWS